MRKQAVKTKRRWFIYKDEKKHEIAAVDDAMLFVKLVKKLSRIVEKERIDLAEPELLTAAIQASLLKGMIWPDDCCIDIFIKAAEKFKLWFHKPEVRENRGKEILDTYAWLVENLETIKKFHSGTLAGFDWNASVECDDDIKNGVRRDLYEMLLDSAGCTNWPDKKRKDIHVLKTDRGLDVQFPVGEIYGSAWDYVEAVRGSFQRLKEKYNSIGIRGLVYYYETISPATSGIYFYCKPEEKKIHSTQEWQRCCKCGKILTKDTFYNSGQWEEGEGNLNCLCSPTCLLDHVMSSSDDSILPNRMMKDEYPELAEDWEVWELNRDKVLWRFLEDNLSRYLKDFSENKEKIKVISRRKSLNVGRWNHFVRLIKQIDKKGFTDIEEMKEKEHHLDP